MVDSYPSRPVVGRFPPAIGYIVLGLLLCAAPILAQPPTGETCGPGFNGGWQSQWSAIVGPVDEDGECNLSSPLEDPGWVEDALFRTPYRLGHRFLIDRSGVRFALAPVVTIREMPDLQTRNMPGHQDGLEIAVPLHLANFDRPAVMDAMERKEKRALSRAGSYIRKSARQSIRKTKKASQPGEPPRSHSNEPNLRTILFAYDPKMATVIAGPVKLSGSKANNLVTETMEHGGTVDGKAFFTSILADLITDSAAS